MKFGKTITSHQVPEWSTSYMDYKGLKKLIKVVVRLQNEIIATAEAQEEEDEEYADEKRDTLSPLEPSDALNNSEVKTALAGFFFSLDRNIEKVDDFFNKQYYEYDRRLKKMTTIVSSFQTQMDDLEGEELEEIIGVLVELRSCFRNLKWFGELNKRGFVKILKKLDKKTGTMQQTAYLNSRIYPLGFATELDIVKDLGLINEYLNKISPHVNDTVFSNGHHSDSSNRSPSVQPDKFVKAINTDDPDALFKQLIAEYRSLVLVPIKLLITLLNKAALTQSENCINKLLEIMPTLGDPGDISGRNFFHHHVIAQGKQVQKREETEKKYADSTGLPILELHSMHISPATPPDSSHRMIGAFGSDGINSNDSPVSLLQILKALPPHLRSALLQRDHYKRTPLHYAAQFGLREITAIIIDFLKSWGEWDSTIPIDDIQYWGDGESLSPLHLAVLGSHPKTVEVLVASCDKKLTNSKILLLAARLNSPLILKTLLGCDGIDINTSDPDHHDETALYIASKLNFPETVKFLLENDADTEIGEASYGWTPIFIAAVEGLYNVVQLLKDAGAEYSAPDESGWTPMEHACLRGHMKIADMLKPDDYDHWQAISAKRMSASPSSDGSRAVSPIPTDFYKNANSSIDKIHSQKKEDILKAIKPKQTPKAPQPVKSFGHRYLCDESVIIVTLGSNDLRDSSPAVKLDRVPISKVHSTELDTALSLVISIKGEINEPPTVVDLPLDEIEPIAIKSKMTDPGEEILLFDIVPTYGGQNKQVLGRAVAMLDKVYPKVGEHRASLNKVVTLPIIETETLDILGTLNFEVLIVTPFNHPNMTMDRTETYWKSLVSTRVIGHRGLGKNTVATKSLQLGENTVESFIAAASLGASYVEFDVQLTKDHMPVVYHDFLVAESGVDIPMHELTSEQFLNLNESATIPETKDDFLLRPRSASYLNHNRGDQLNKMKLTKTFKNLGFKGNSRGSSIASSFVTLKDLFKKIPKNVGFNIECKYPLLYEAQEEDLSEVTVDLNYWIDTVLNVVYDYADGRDIIFSSFHPEACLMLSLKQPAIPILFLTEAGTNTMPDVRCISLQSAVRFAKRWNLLGIVSAAEPVVKCPRLAQVVKSSGLVCVTYGTLNNDPKNSKLQMEAGVDAVIVDNVLAVRTELTKDAKKDPAQVDAQITV